MIFFLISNKYNIQGVFGIQILFVSMGKKEISSYQSTLTCKVNRDSESGFVLFKILPFGYTSVW